MEKKPVTIKKEGKFPHKGRAGFLARRTLAETKQQKGDPASAAVPRSDKRQTGWGGVAQWYHDTVEDKGSYQKDLILPNIIRLLDIKKGESVLDLACGEGFFTRRFLNNGAQVIGVDIAKELIDIAQKQSPDIRYFVSGADKIPFVSSASVEKVTIILALQNIENVTGVFKECSRVLKPGGRLFIVLNHPAFRIPKASGWGWVGNDVQFRRIDAYMSERREKIDMAPGAKTGQTTVSFHRPLQFYVKLLGKNGLAVTNMEEWVSPKKSMPGPRAAAEDKARAEIPLFMLLEIKKI
jgi:SAM-dependent methyltransferase